MVNEASSRLKVLRRTYDPPQPGDRRYVQLSEQGLGARVLNGQTRVVRRVTVVGMALTLDKADTTGLLQTTRDADDVAEVCIVADSVSIGTILTFRGAHVSVYARSLTFASPDAYIDTSPPPRTARDPRNIDGRQGLPAGDITVVVDAFNPASPTAKHFRANGGPGEAGDDGGLKPQTGTRKDVRPLTPQEWERLMNPKNRRVPHEEVLWQKDGYVSTLPYISFATAQKEAKSKSGGVLTYAEINNSYYTNNFHTNASPPEVIASIGSKDLPGQGPDGSLPGRGGAGGAGGKLRVVKQVAANCVAEGGSSGHLLTPSSSPGGRGGTPDVAVWAIIEGRPAGSQQNFTTRYTVAGRSSAGAWSPKRTATIPANGSKGEITPLQGMAAQTWVNAVSLSAVLSFAHDAVAANDWSTAMLSLQPYLAVVAPVGDGSGAASAPVLTELATETPTLLGDAAALNSAVQEAVSVSEAATDLLDEYGNPVGWAPSVSLDTALDVYSAILDGAMSQLKLAYTLQRAWTTISTRNEHLEAMITAMTDASENARKDLVTSRSALVRTSSGTSPLREMSALLAESKEKALQLTERLDELRKKADEQQLTDDQKHAVAEGLKIAGAFVKAIPLPEPYQTITGGIGTLSEVTAAFVDQGGSDEAFDSLESQVKAFTDREDLGDAFTTDLDAAMGANDKRSQSLSNQADDVATQLAKLDDQRNKANEAATARDQAAETAAKARQTFLAAHRSKGTADDSEQKATKSALDTLDEAEKSLQAQQKQVEGQQTELEKANKALTSTKEERVETVKSAAAKIERLASGVTEIGKAINGLTVYESALDTRWAATLAKIAEKDDRLSSLKRDIDYLNRRKWLVAMTIKKQERLMSTAAATIARNAAALVELRAQRAHTHDALDPQALAFIQASQRDAQRTLAQFLYYVVKAYEYYTVKPWQSSQYAMVNQIFTKLGALLARSQEPAAKDIDPDDLSDLKGVYEAPLLEMGRQIAQNLLTGQAGRQDIITDQLSLSPSVLAQLNASMAGEASIASAVFNPAALGWLDTAKERQRIRSIEVKSVSARNIDGAGLPARIVFTFTHSGRSIVRADGCLYAFNAADNRPETPLHPTVTWETRASGTKMWDARDDDPGVFEVIDGALSVVKPGEEGNLLSRLMKDSRSASELEKLTSFRPGGFSNLEVILEISPPSARLELTDVVLSVEQEAVTDTSRAMVVVLCNVDTPVQMHLSRPDLSGTNAGWCDLYALFDHRDLKSTPVQLSAPPEVAGRLFSRWLINGTPAEAVTGEPTSVTVSQSCQAMAEYAPAP